MSERLRELEAQIDALRAEAAAIQLEQHEASSYDPRAAAAALAASRDYARSVRDHGEADAVRGCATALAKYGFCVLEHVIPKADIPRVRTEIVEATEHGMHSSSPVLDLPHLGEFLGAPAVTGVVRECLDEHIRIAQINTRPVRADVPDPTVQWNRDREGMEAQARGPQWREW